MITIGCKTWVIDQIIFQASSAFVGYVKHIDIIVVKHKAADIGLADVVAYMVVTSEALGTPVVDNGLASQP